MNLIFIIIDSLNADHVGINGNDWIKTPSLDKFGRESVRFTGAYPESLPTVPVRRGCSSDRSVWFSCFYDVHIAAWKVECLTSGDDYASAAKPQIDWDDPEDRARAHDRAGP